MEHPTAILEKQTNKQTNTSSSDKQVSKWAVVKSQHKQFTNSTNYNLQLGNKSQMVFTYLTYVNFVGIT